MNDNFLDFCIGEADRYTYDSILKIHPNDVDIYLDYIDSEFLNILNSTTSWAGEPIGDISSIMNYIYTTNDDTSKRIINAIKSCDDTLKTMWGYND